MKEINDISAEDLRALEALDQNCIDLHLFPPPKTFIQLDVEGPDGTKVLSRKLRSQSWNRNAYNLILNTFGALPTNLLGDSIAPGTTVLKAIGSQTISSTIWGPLQAGNVGGAGAINRGIVVGASNSPESFEGYSLCSQIMEGTSVDKIMLTGLEYFRNLAGAPSGGAYDAVVDPTGAYLILSTATAGKFLVGFSLDSEGFISGLLPAISSPANYPRVTLSWSPDGDYFACIYSSTLNIYKNNRDGTFTLLSPITTPSSASGYSLSWSPDSSMLAVGISGGNFLVIYTNNGDDTFTLKTGVPAAAALVAQSAWSPDGTYLACACSGSTVLTIYKNVAGTLSRLTLTALTSAPTAVSWLPDGSHLYFHQNGSPYGQVLKNNNNDTFDTVALTALGGSTCLGAWDSTGKYHLTGNSSTYQYMQAVKHVAGAFSSINGPAAYNCGSVGNPPTRIVAHPSKPVFYCCFGNSGPTFAQGVVGPTLSHVAQSATSASYNAGTKKMSLTLQRIFNNNTAVAQTVKELGIYQLNSNSTDIIMPTRDVLAVPVVIPSAYKLTVTYTIEITYPA